MLSYSLVRTISSRTCTWQMHTTAKSTLSLPWPQSSAIFLTFEPGLNILHDFRYSNIWYFHLRIFWLLLEALGVFLLKRSRPELFNPHVALSDSRSRVRKRIASTSAKYVTSYYSFGCWIKRGGGGCMQTISSRKIRCL